MNSFPRRFVLVGAVLGIPLFYLGCSRENPRAGSAAAAGPPRAVPVEAVTVSLRSAERLLEVTGTLQPFDKVTVSLEVDGTVRRVLVDLGDRVRERQLLAEVDPEEFKIEVEQSAARLHQALAALGLKEGQDPHSIRNEDTPEVRSALSGLEEAEQNFRRANELFRERIGTEQNVDQATAQLKRSQANLSLAHQNVETLRAQIQQYRAALELAKKRLKETAVTAPFSGSIAERQVSLGQYVKAQTPLFTIVQTNPLRLRAEVPERLAPVVRQNQQLELKVDGFPGRTFEGKIWRISPSVSEQSRTLMVEALVRNDAETLRPGMFTRASIQSGQMASAVMIPATGVLNFYGVTKVFCINDGKIQDRTVKLGDRFEDYFEVLEGLKDKEVVAVSNLERLSVGTLVEVKRQ